MTNQAASQPSSRRPPAPLGRLVATCRAGGDNVGVIDVQDLAAFIASRIAGHFGVEVPPEAVQLEFNEWRWMAAVRNLAIVFVAEDEPAERRLNAERTVLRLLPSRVNFGLPVPFFCSGSRPQIDIREFAPGETGPEFHRSLLAQPSLGLAAAERMAVMLAELHGSMSSSDAAAAGLTQLGGGPWPSSRIREVLGVRLDNSLRRLFDKVLEWHTENQRRAAVEAVLVHHDFGSHNFTFDAKTGLPCGLFDFETMCWNDRHCDFNLLPSYGDEIMTRTIETYSTLTGNAISVDRVRLHHAVYALSNVAWRSTFFPLESSEVTGGMKWVAQALAACDGIHVG